MWCCLSLFLNARIFNIDLRRDFSLIFFSNGDQFYLCSYFILKKKSFTFYFCTSVFYFRKGQPMWLLLMTHLCTDF